MEIREMIISILSVYSKLENTNQYLHENDDLNKLGMNSFTFVKMVVALEREFNISFDDADLDYSKFTSLNMLCNYVEDMMRASNVIYRPADKDKSDNTIRKGFIELLLRHCDNPIISQPAFNDIVDLELDQNQLEGLISDIKEKYNVDLDLGIIQRERLILVNDICKYIECNRKGNNYEKSIVSLTD